MRWITSRGRPGASWAFLKELARSVRWIGQCAVTFYFSNYFIYMYTYIRVHMYTRTSVCTRVRTYVYTYVRVRVAI